MAIIGGLFGIVIAGLIVLALMLQLEGFRSEDDVRMLRGLGREELLHDEEVEALERRLDPRRVGV